MPSYRLRSQLCSVWPYAVIFSDISVTIQGFVFVKLFCNHKCHVHLMLMYSYVCLCREYICKHVFLYYCHFDKIDNNLIIVWKRLPFHKKRKGLVTLAFKICSVLQKTGNTNQIELLRELSCRRVCHEVL